MKKIFSRYFLNLVLLLLSKEITCSPTATGSQTFLFFFQIVGTEVKSQLPKLTSINKRLFRTTKPTKYLTKNKKEKSNYIEKYISHCEKICKNISFLHTLTLSKLTFHRRLYLKKKKNIPLPSFSL